MKYLIDVPPPTISGSLHLGHLFSYSHMDVVARNAKRKGMELVYPFCFDNNGLPTEKLASKAGITDPEQIYSYSVETSWKYGQLFEDMNMAMTGLTYAGGEYHTLDEKAIDLADQSFNDLLAKGLVYKAEAEYLYCPLFKTSVSQSEVDENGIYERSGAKVEKRVGEGWFIKIKENIPRIRTAIDEINWHPVDFKHRLHRWLDDVQYDWSISRTRNYGIRMKHDPQFVYDTWFTSSLSPQLAYSAHTGVPSLQCPIFDCRFQAHDIIRTWALFTIVKSLYHNDQIPWRNIIISGHALSPKGEKLAKSLGNASDPYEYIKRYGSDGVRYWACHTQTGTDTRVDLETMNYGKKLCNKIRNAKKFLDKQTTNGEEGPAEFLHLTRYQTWEFVRPYIDDYLDKFLWADALNALRSFFWNDFCDKWIEGVKHGSDSVGTLRLIFSEMLPYFGIFMPKIEAELK